MNSEPTNDEIDLNIASGALMAARGIGSFFLLIEGRYILNNHLSSLLD